MTEKQQLTEQEQAFLDYLFDGNNIRHPDEAKVMAGYPQDYPWLNIVKKCNEELVKKYDNYLTVVSAKGLMGLMDIIENPMIPGSAVKLKAIIELLDRGGVTKKEKSEQETIAPNYVFLLPPKEEIKEN